jgi:hypothetical protein
MVMSTLASLHGGRWIARGSDPAATCHSITSAIVNVITVLVCMACISIVFGCSTNGPGKVSEGPVPAFRGPWYFVDAAVIDAVLVFDMAVERSIDLDDARRRYDLLSTRSEPGRLVIARKGGPDEGDAVFDIEFVDVRIGRVRDADAEGALKSRIKTRLSQLQSDWASGGGSSAE